MDIQLTNLKKSFGDNVAVDISQFTIHTGDILGLVGNNGAGKTTLFRLMLDLLSANEGEVAYVPSESDADLFADQQAPESLNPATTEDWKTWTGAYIDEGFLIDFLTPEEYFDFIAKVNGLQPIDWEKVMALDAALNAKESESPTTPMSEATTESPSEPASEAAEQTTESPAESAEPTTEPASETPEPATESSEEPAQPTDEPATETPSDAAEAEEPVDFLLDAYLRLASGELFGKKKLIRDYSAGNKQKIGIIGALLNHPRVLILDEPFNFLDPSGQNILKKMIVDYHRRTGATILISSHNLQHTIEVSTRVALLEHGKIVEDLHNDNGSAATALNSYFQV